MAGGHPMSKLPDPNDVEFFVGDVEPDPRLSIETARIIEEDKNRPDYPLEAEEAEQILAALRINARDYGMQDAKSLLDHWHGCVAELSGPISLGPMQKASSRTREGSVSALILS